MITENNSLKPAKVIMKARMIVSPTKEQWRKTVTNKPIRKMTGN
jgi:hypothetical protein